MAHGKQLPKLLALLEHTTSEYAPLIAERLGDLLDGVDATEEASALKRQAVAIIYPHLSSRQWQTRAAASLCLEAVCWRSTIAELPRSETVRKLRSTWLILDKIDVPSFHKHGTPLRSRPPKQLVEEEPEGGAGLESRVRRQRKQLLRCLGQLDDDVEGLLETTSYYGGVAALVTQEDVAPASKLIVSDVTVGTTSGGGGGCAGSNIRNSSAQSAVALQLAGASTVGTTSSRAAGAMSCAEASASTTSTQELCLLVANDLVFQLFSQTWEERHGAAVGLLALLRAWSRPPPQQRQQQPQHAAQLPQQQEQHQLDATVVGCWAEDVATACMCVLLLDRFGDYGGGVGVIAPIRETAAQALGLAATLLPSARQAHFVRKLHDMHACGLPTPLETAMGVSPAPAQHGGGEYHNEAWEARHGAQLGVLYLASLVARAGSHVGGVQAADLLDTLATLGLRGLGDSSEDVNAAAAKALQVVLTAANGAPQHQQAQVRLAVQTTAEALQHIERDNISACVAAFMRLLELCCCPASSSTAQPCGARCAPGMVCPLLPRLLVLWDHPNAAVRTSTAHVVGAAMAPSSSSDSAYEAEAYLEAVLCRCMWGILCDGDSQACAACYACWRQLMACGAALPRATQRALDAVLSLYLTPDGQLAQMAERSNTEDVADIGERPAKQRRLSAPHGDEHGTAPSLASAPAAPAVHGGSGVTHASRLRAGGALREALVELSSGDADQMVARLAAVAESADWSCQREGAMLLLAECAALWVGEVSRRTAVMRVVEGVMAGMVPATGAGQPNNDANVQQLKELAALRDYVKHANARQLAAYLRASPASNGDSGEAAAWGDRAKQGKEQLARAAAELRRRRACAGVKCVIAAAEPGLPPQLNPVLRPLMDAVKREPDNDRHSDLAGTLAKLVMALLKSDNASHTTAVGKVLGNTLSFLAAPSAADSPHRQAGARKVVVALSEMLQHSETQATTALHEWICRSLDPLTTPAQPADQLRASPPSSSLSPESRALALLTALLPTPEEQEQGRQFPSQLIAHLEGTPLIAILLVLARGKGALQQQPPQQQQQATADADREAALQALVRIAQLQVLPVWLQLRASLLPSIIATATAAAATALPPTAAAPTETADRARDVHILVALLQGMPRAALLPHAAALLPVVLRCATDEDPAVRSAVAGVFTQLLRDVSLSPAATTDDRASASAANDTSSGAADELSRNGELIIRHLVRGEPLDMLRHDTLPAAVTRALPADVTLRPYQWEGVTWCDFLRRTGTNGVLADEMGLGKTLQALLACAICRAHSGDTAAPALVICPPTLVHHWQAEATRFLGAFFKHILVYAGVPAKRKQLATQFATQALVVTSYPVVQRDWSTLSQSRWSYLILDEAHLLRNPNSAVAGAVRALRSDHRLALTGTPIQNTVAEVWAIFHLVMPGYLGERSDFKSSYVTPTRAVLESGGRVGGVGEVLEGMRVLDRLHRQVLPFVLRREKAQVLTDLPPKIITDMACEMPPRQRQAYEQLCRAMRQGGAAAEQGDKQREVFKWLALQQLACVHPALVLNKTQPATGADAKTVTPAASMPLGDSCKLLALRQLLWDCGIGLQDCSDGSEAGDAEAPADADAAAEQPAEGAPADAEGAQQQLQRKCLVFAQHKAALDATEQCVLRQHLPSVKYLRIDGSIGQDARAAVLERFASDAAVSLLLLTTAVGGLGLNLTVADTVIFLEHHWNPQVDLQAMDRAHRIGQRRAVNVYRLVATGTVEERILLLQAGKLATAEKVVGKDNASLWSLDTDSVLQLFSAAIDASGAADGSGAASTDGAAADERQLQDEYASFDAEHFAVSMRHLNDS